MTFSWRGRVNKALNYMPPTAYHRILMFLWLVDYSDEVNYTSLDDLSIKVGTSRGAIGAVITRMITEGVIHSSTNNPRGTLSLTPFGRTIIEL